MIERGTLALIVGPSGVGKDSLIAHARAALTDDQRFCFPSRSITRPTVAGPESHVALTGDAFDTAETHGAFFLTWRAHDVAYGIPSTVVDDLDRDSVVVANVSRAVIAEACARVRSTVVIQVTAPRELLMQRLALRGRESRAAIAQRLERTLPLPPTQAPVIEIDNSGEIEIAAARLTEVLRGLAVSQAHIVR